MYMLVHEFRKDLKSCLDRAQRGEKVEFERAGIVFELKAKGMIMNVVEEATLTRPDEFVPTTPPIAKKPKESPPSELAPRFCKNGHPIPYPRDRCLGKGCKYA